MTELEDLKKALANERSAREEIEKRLQEKTEELHAKNQLLAEENKLLNIQHEELKITQRQLIQSSKLASIGQLAAGVAHEINNPIGYVSNNINVLHEYSNKFVTLFDMFLKLMALLQDNPQLQQPIQDIHTYIEKNDISFMLTDVKALILESKTGMSRVIDIVASLKTFARMDQDDVHRVNINEVIESNLKIVWNEIKYKCTVEKNFGDLPDLACYPSQLHQVFTNLLVNASQAIEESGIIKITTNFDGHNIKISIADSGSGIPKECLDKIFDPFFTTKPIGIGTGLGLSVTYGIIQNHHGQIDIQSEINKGTTVMITLPLDGVKLSHKK